MFTNNYIKYRELMFYNGGYGSYKYLKSVGGTDAACHAGQGIYTEIGSWMPQGQCRAVVEKITGQTGPGNLYSGVYFGSGTTPPTKADYKLESVITSGLKITSTPLSLGGSNGEYSAKATFILENTSSNDISVSEIGIITPFCAEGKNSYIVATTYYNTLMERSVLDTPVVIAPGEIKTITYKITFNQSVS